MELRDGRGLVHTGVMKNVMTTSRPGVDPGNSRGTTVLEACAAIALTAAAAVAIVDGLEPLVCAFRLEAARSTLVDVLLEARRFAYERDVNALVEAHVGDTSVRLDAATPQPLGEGVVITAAPSDGNVTFRSTGLADNATVAIACGEATASVVVNQRGVIR